MEFDLVEKEPLEVKALLDANTSDIMLLDVREQWEYDLCHIPNSIHIPLSDITTRISELQKSDPIIIICHNGRRSLNIGLELITKGFDNVINLKGGVDQWADDIDNTMAKYGIKEIDNEDYLEPNLFHTLFVPFVGVDKNGCRLGYGGGYFDRALEGIESVSNKPLIVGMGYDYQIVNDEFGMSHDIKYDIVITETRVLSFN